MNSTMSFRPYDSSDMTSCLAVFDSNCPAYFAPNEREDYLKFLEASPEGYEVCEMAGRIVAVFGLVRVGLDTGRITWIMLHRNVQGNGLGTALMDRIISRGGNSDMTLIRIAASQKSAVFFERFGAVSTEYIKNGWGPGMDRIDMELHI